MSTREKPEKPVEPNGAASRLRADIDSGRTGDKVPASDPAAAPLGTDAEAGGNPMDPGELREARRNERKGPHTKKQN